MSLAGITVAGMVLAGMNLAGMSLHRGRETVAGLDFEQV